MNVTPYLTKPCTIVPRTTGAVDEYNDEVLTDGTPVVTVCEFQPRAGTETTDGGVIETDVVRIYLLPTVEIDALARITVDGDDYELTQPPALRRHPRTGDAVHWEVDAKAIT